MNAASHMKTPLEGVEVEAESVALVIIAKGQNLIFKTKGEIYFRYSKKMSKDDPRGLSGSIPAGVMWVKVMGSEGDPTHISFSAPVPPPGLLHSRSQLPAHVLQERPHSHFWWSLPPRLLPSMAVQALTLL